MINQARRESDLASAPSAERNFFNEITGPHNLIVPSTDAIRYSGPLAEKISKSRILLLVGLPGSGKSTWVSGKSGVLSSDALRELLADDPANQTIHPLVFRVMRDLLKHRLELKRPRDFHRCHQS